MDQVVAIHLDRGSLRCLSRKWSLNQRDVYKTYSTYGTHIGAHWLALLVPVLGSLIMSPTVCDVLSRNICFRIDIT